MKIANIVFAILILLITLPSLAKSMDRKDVVVSATLSHSVHVGEVYLNYKNNPIASISIYGSWPSIIDWLVDARVINCEQFETFKPYLTVTRNGSEPLDVLHYSARANPKSYTAPYEEQYLLTLNRRSSSVGLWVESNQPYEA